MDQLKKQFKDDPVVFIGINSGNDPKQCLAYAKRVKTEWAIYADVDRSFEQSVIKTTISLQNIHQCRIVTPDGKLHNSSDSAEEVKKHLDGAKWQIDPKEIPEPLKKGWSAFEFSQFSVASPLIKAATSATDPKVKAAALKMEGLIKEQATKAFNDAQALNTAGKKWEAYKAYDVVLQNFKPYPEGPKAQTEMTKLKPDKKVAKELQAKTMLTQIQTWAASKVKADHENARAGLAILQKDFADTEAGEASKGVKLPEKPEKPAA